MRLSLQLYTLRDALSADVEGTLKTVAAIGLKFVELAGMYDRSASDWKTLLDANGLIANGNHVGIDSIESDFDGVVRDNKTLGNMNVIVPWVGENHYGAGWDKFAERMNEVGAKLAAEGLNLLYHNHAFEFETKDGEIGLDLFYKTAKADLVKAELDVAWVQIGGANPVDYINTLSGRIPLVHLKDYDPTKTPQWQPAGEGIVDWDAVLAACAKANVEYGAIELDEAAGDPVEAVRKSFNFFAAKGLS